MSGQSPTAVAASAASPLDAWLRLCDLSSNPFDRTKLDAGADPQISLYLVGHQSFDAIWKDQASLVFAPVGGGKSAFRVRLAHACRVGQDGRRILPVVYKLPEPRHFASEETALEMHYRFLARGMACELLLLLLYRPERFAALNPDDQRDLAGSLHRLPVDAGGLLEQIQDRGTFHPLLRFYDGTASQLPGQAGPAAIGELCTRLGELLAATQTKAGAARDIFFALAGLVRSLLGYEAIYLLLDGVDAYDATAGNALAALEVLNPLLHEPALHSAGVYTKYFLPEELETRLTPRRLLDHGGVFDATLVDIHWTHDSLLALLKARLRVASQGRFDSLDALSSPALRGVESLLIDRARHSPRRLLALANRLLELHVGRDPDGERLEPADWERLQEDRELEAYL